MYSWGANDYGQCGMGTGNSFIEKPEQIPFFFFHQNIKSVYAGKNNSAAIIGDSLYTWGES